MAVYFPVTLEGNNLGERHRYLNSLVNDAYQKKIPFQSIQDFPEHSAIDRLFKIDLASKLRHTEYILSNLKDDDMLYVSRALHSSWLLEPQYNDIINPAYLDKILYPELTTTAVNKMNNWLQVHLKDPSRCFEFFQYYSEKNFDLALKFLWNCPEDVIADTTVRMLKQITPKRLKLLCEKCPRAVRIYFDLMLKDNEVMSKYSDHEEYYYRCLTNLINTDSNLLLNIAEKYYNSDCCDAFSPSITRKIMSKHKDQYVKKPELYAAWLLHIPTLAKCLNDDEIKDIVLRLARAEYLGRNFFSYKRVEPFIKQLSQNEREKFKKLVFVEKCIGDKIKDWPYEPPASPCLDRNFEKHIFKDKKYLLHYHDYNTNDLLMMDCCENIGYAGWAHFQEETLLDKLFNKYRCINFKTTFIELGKKIQAETSVQTREYMMLVLVSKTGGLEDNVKDLLEMLVLKHNNEADNFRATVVRSLVKRAKVWQLPNNLWKLLLKFAHGLGLDGEKSDENCIEGLYAVVLRSILLDEECPPKVFSVYLERFSTFAELKLSKDEKGKVAEKLPFLLLTSAKEQAEPNEAVTRLAALIKVLHDYNLKINDFPEVIPVISMLARQDSEACRDLLSQLYNARVARKDLLLENFTFMQSNESYLNILRHDSQILMETNNFEELTSELIDHDQFLRKLGIYFSENQGVAKKYLSIIVNELSKNPRGDLVRSFAILAGSSLFKELQNVDGVGEKTAEQKGLAVAYRTYGHLARPKLDLFALGWRAAGVKAVANQISICSAKKVEENMRLLLDWPRASRLTFVLAERIDKEVEILSLIARVRPTVAIKITLRHLKQRGESFNPEIWKIGKAALKLTDLSLPKYEHLVDRLLELVELDCLSERLKADYGAAMYKVLDNVSKNKATAVLITMEEYLSNADENFIVGVIQEFLANDLTAEKDPESEYEDNERTYLILRMIGKYLLLCRSEEIQRQRIETICKPFLNYMKILFGKEDSSLFFNYWKNFMFNLRCTDAFIDTSYVTCLPVMQHIVEWLKDFLPIVEYVDIYFAMHLIMLYVKAIRQSVKQNPLIFFNEVERNEIGVEIVGVIFGKYISHEIVQLKTEYFESIVEIYAKSLIKFLSASFHICKSFWLFVSALIKGMLKEQDSPSRLLAEKVFVEHRHSLDELKGDKTSDLFQGIGDKQLKFFMKTDMENIFAD